MNYILAGTKQLTAEQLAEAISRLDGQTPVCIMDDNAKNEQDTRPVYDIAFHDGKLIICDF